MIKRAHPEIMKDIANIYCRLSPENLSCDGEMSMVETRRRQKYLTNRLDELFKEIGRNVSETEALDMENQ